MKKLLFTFILLFAGLMNINCMNENPVEQKIDVVDQNWKKLCKKCSDNIKLENTEAKQKLKDTIICCNNQLFVADQSTQKGFFKAILKLAKKDSNIKKVTDMLRALYLRHSVSIIIKKLYPDMSYRYFPPSNQLESDIITNAVYKKLLEYIDRVILFDYLDAGIKVSFLYSENYNNFLSNLEIHLKNHVIDQKEREEAVKEREEAVKEREEAVKEREEAVKEREEKEREEAVKERENKGFTKTQIAIMIACYTALVVIVTWLLIPTDDNLVCFGNRKICFGRWR